MNIIKTILFYIASLIALLPFLVMAFILIIIQ